MISPRPSGERFGRVSSRFRAEPSLSVGDLDTKLSADNLSG
ncbi:hypothetical protein I546_1521 [Mycobacterium kansasii 732]|nr:hypothetical protein I546_1521 [Mycobacterium kansasii 732]